jgi:hypothetical protein
MDAFELGVMDGMEKTASGEERQRYMQRRAMVLQKKRMYRLKNAQKLKRKSRLYRKKVKRKAHRPKKRVGSLSGGYTFLMR